MDDALAGPLPARSVLRPPRDAVRASGAEQPSQPDLADDLRLFALTFAGGFLFMSVYLA